MSEQDPSSKPSFTDIFTTRPIVSVVLSLFLILAGLRASLELPILQYPKVDSSQLIISTPYIGASAQKVQGFVTEPIERAAASVPGVDYVDSNTQAGLSTVTAWLKLNEDSTRALAELTARLNQIRFELPAGAEDPAVRVQRADRPAAAFYLDVHFDESLDMSRAEVTDYLNRRVNPLLASIPGVQRAGIEGGRSPAMRIWLDPQKLRQHNLSSLEVNQALRANNFIATMGRSDNPTLKINLLSNTSLSTVDEFKRLVVRDNDQGRIVLADIATVEMGEDEGDLNARLDNELVLYISIWPLPGANEIEIGDQLYRVLDEVNAALPPGLRIGIGFDGTLYMRNSLREIFITLAETVLLVGIVVVAMMGSFRTALVPLVTIPISILGAVAAMTIMGFTLNLLTVLAIVLSVGLVVDDAIVVVENVARYMRQGMNRIDAALHSSRQLLAPITGMTITLAAVYAPIGFLSGLTGSLFREFAFTLAVAVLISGIVAITLSPILSAYACPPGGSEGKLTLTVNRWFDRLKERYSRLLLASFAWRKQILFAAIYLSLLAIPFYMLSLKELAPTEDQSSINVIVESAPEASVEYTTQYMNEVVDTLHTLPGTRYMWQIVTPAGGFGGLALKPFNEREQDVHSLFPQAFVKLSGVTGVRALPVLFPALPTAGNFSVEMVVLSTDSSEEMLPYAQQLITAAYGSQKFLFADTDLKVDLPLAQINFDHQKVADMGMTLADISQQLSAQMSGNYVNRFDFDGRAYRVIPKLRDELRPDPASIMGLRILTPDNDWIALQDIAELEMLTGPRVLGKFQQKNAFRIYGGVIPGTTKEQALSFLEQQAKDILPPGYTIDYAGESRQLRQEGSTLTGVLVIALIIVFMVLAIQFNSLRDPLIVLLGSVPLALSGAMMFTFINWTSINIYSQVGFITLVGLIAKNGILIVEFANHLQMTGRSKFEAIKEASATRLRPVLMTTGATVLGHLPLVLVTGAGAEARNSIGIILVAGMLVGTFFTLIVLPNVYMALASDHSKDS